MCLRSTDLACAAVTRTGASIALAAIGLAGVVGYSVARRTAEIGVRMALGAGPRDVAWLVLREAVRLGGAGGAVGLLAAAAGTRILAGCAINRNR